MTVQETAATVHPYDLAAVLLALTRRDPVEATRGPAVACWLALDHETRGIALLALMDEMPELVVTFTETLKAAAEAEVERLRRRVGEAW